MGNFSSKSSKSFRSYKELSFSWEGGVYSHHIPKSEFKCEINYELVYFTTLNCSQIYFCWHDRYNSRKLYKNIISKYFNSFMTEVSIISMDWFLYDRELLHETVHVSKVNSNQSYSDTTKYFISMHMEKTVINFSDFQTCAIPPCTRYL